MKALTDDAVDWCLLVEANRFYVLKYFTKRSRRQDDTSQLIWDFKSGDEGAITRCIDLVLGGLWAAVPDRLTKYQYIAPAPSSTGPARPGAIRLCNAVASEFDLFCLPTAFTRVVSVPKAHLAERGGRPDVQTHLKSMRYTGGIMLEGTRTLVFDDVYTTGATFAACSTLLKAAGARSVGGIFLGRTQR